MGAHRLAALRHRHQQFDRQLTEELSSKSPDQEAMHFFKSQKLRIKDLIAEIEALPAHDAQSRPAIAFEAEEPDLKQASA